MFWGIDRTTPCPSFAKEGNRTRDFRLTQYPSNQYRDKTCNNSSDWSPDGRWLLFTSQSTKTARYIWVLPMEGENKPIAIAQTAADESGARFSPDGHWIAYQSNESGRNEIYVQPFPGPGARSQISTGGGNSIQWRRHGKEVFYQAPNNRLMRASVSLNGPRVEPGVPVTLFTLTAGASYAASPDEQRFLVNEITRDASPITILMNWRPR